MFSCFVWLLAREAVLTQENLTKRMFTLCSRCLLCGEIAETMNHLFLYSKIIERLWRMFIILRGISWIMHERIIDVLHSWEEAGSQAIDRDNWRTVPTSIWWKIWKKRNSRCSDNVENSLQKIRLNCPFCFCVFGVNRLTQRILLI